MDKNFFDFHQMKIKDLISNFNLGKKQQQKIQSKMVEIVSFI